MNGRNLTFEKIPKKKIATNLIKIVLLPLGASPAGQGKAKQF